MKHYYVLNLLRNEKIRFRPDLLKQPMDHFVKFHLILHLSRSYIYWGDINVYRVVPE